VTGRPGAGIVRLLVTLLVLLAVHFPLVAAEPRRDEPPRAAGGVYRRPLRYDPATLDPAKVRDIYALAVTQQIFDGLVQFDHTLTVVPGIARFWRASRDGLTWTFHLREGLRFHHGREVTSDDVVYSLTRLLDPRTKSGAADLFTTIRGAREFRQGAARHVSGLEALDRHTVQVSLTESLAPFVSLLAVGHAKIVPRDVVEREGDAFGEHPVGTGPFRFVRWERGREIVLGANPGHFQGAPALSRVVFRIFPGASFDGVFDEFVKGNLEDAPIPTTLSAQEYRQIVTDPSRQHVKRSQFSVRFYGFNTRVRPFDDVRVRQALVHAIDREALVEDLYLGRFVVARGVLPPGTFGYNPRLVAPAYDPARARELLASAGFPGGRGLPRIDIWSSVNDQRTQREHAQLTRWLEAVGVQARVQYVTDWPSFSRGVTDGRFPVFLYAWYADAPDPDNFLFKLFHSQSPRNLFGYKNPSVDDALLRARTETDPLRRAELYRRAEQAVVDDAPLIPVWHYTYERLFQRYVRSVEVNGLGDPYIPLRKIWLDRP
jgi:peptide/nickel transport system substrate-binding protein/oligopeptide transport system substrate-binding protein